jgi:hypothetical protein
MTVNIFGNSLVIFRNQNGIESNSSHRVRRVTKLVLNRVDRFSTRPINEKEQTAFRNHDVELLQHFTI